MEQSSIPEEPLASATRARTTIEALPPELLLIIFQYCHENFQREEENQFKLTHPPWHYVSGGLHPLSMRPTSPSDMFDRFRSPFRFPFALAAVSPFWNDLLLSQPKYWKEIICSIGSNTSNLELARIKRQLKLYPRDILLGDVIVLKGESSDDQDRETEQISQETTELCAIVQNLVRECFSQLRTLSIENGTRTSFLNLSTCHHQFLNLEICLSSLLLARDGKDSYQLESPPAGAPLNTISGLQPCTHLTTLSVHGRYLDGFYPTFFDQKMSRLDQLIISDYESSGDGLSVGDILEIFPHLRSLAKLKLQNVDFSLPPNFDLRRYRECLVTFLHLECMSPSMITLLFGACNFPDLESVHLTRCVYIADLNIIDAETLVFDDITIVPTDSLGMELQGWIGSTLWLGRYQGSSDRFLDFLIENSKGGHLECWYLHTLYLYQIPVLSLEKLKKVVERRNESVDYTNPDWKVTINCTSPKSPATLSKLSIDQCGIERLTEEDVEWFSSRLEFVYIP